MGCVSDAGETLWGSACCCWGALAELPAEPLDSCSVRKHHAQPCREVPGSACRVESCVSALACQCYSSL